MSDPYVINSVLSIELVGTEIDLQFTDGADTLTLRAPLLTGNNILTLPEATDTVVARNTVDILTNKNLTTPIITGSINDINSNELLTLTSVGGATNNLEISNSTTSPSLAAVGDDTNISLDITAKGTGTFNFLGTTATSAELRLFEDSTNGTDYIGLKAPAGILGSVTFTLPDEDGDNKDVIITDGSGNLSFLDPESLGFTYTISSLQIDVPNGTTDFAYFAWDQSAYSLITGGTVRLWYVVSSRGFTFNVIDDSGPTTIGTATVTAGSGSGILSFDLTSVPTADTSITFQVAKNLPGGNDPQLFGIHIRFN